MIRGWQAAACGCLVAAALGWAAQVPAAETVFPIPEWQTATPESQGMSAAGMAKVHDWLKEAGSKTGLVVRHGRIVGEWYFDDATRDSKYLVYSTTKSVASTAAGLAIAAGKLRLDDTVGKFLPDAAPLEKRAVTVKQLLSMTSGVHNDPGIHAREDLFRYAVGAAPQDHPPGAKWDYNNTGLALLSPLFKQAVGQPLDAFTGEKLFAPLGIDRQAWSWEQRDGHPLSYSGLHITARGLARFGLLFLNRGRWGDKQLLSADWVAEATRSSQTLNPQYGYLWWNNSTGKWPGAPRDAYAALGKWDNSLLIVPSLDLLVLRQVGDDSVANHKLNIGELLKRTIDACQDAPRAEK